MVKELNQRCQCDYQVDGITNAGFRCFLESPTAVTFRAEISESPSLPATQLVSSLEAWVSSGSVVLVQAQLLNVETTCATIIDSFSEGECTTITTGDTSVNVTLAPGTGVNVTLVSVVVLVVIIALAVIVILIALLMFRKHKKRDKLDLTKSAPGPLE